MLGDQTCLSDLRKAYLQLHVDVDLQRFQAVRFHNKEYVMTRVGFGLNVAPKIMSRILAKVLSLDEAVCKGTDHYIDDILVNQAVSASDKGEGASVEVRLSLIESEALSSSRVLGLRVRAGSCGRLDWSSDCELPTAQPQVTKRELYSVCGRYVGHYPVAGWLRVACSYMKREVNSYDWESHIPKHVVRILNEVSEKVKKKDPVCGHWTVAAPGSGRVWCDASSLAIGACRDWQSNSGGCLMAAKIG